MPNVLHQVVGRWRRYEAAGVARQIADHDAMLWGDDRDAYLKVGRSAIEVIARAMIAARKPDIASVLDLPCGAGRVTRHLRAFFPDADLFVSDLDKRGECFAAETFAARPIEAALLTHLPERRFVDAFDWLSAGLSPGALLVLTLHGRRADHVERSFNHHIDPAKWQRVREAAFTHGFGFVETERLGRMVYGYSLTAPSWVMRTAERRPLLRVISYQEAAWNDHQDAIVLQRKAIDV